MDQVMNSAPIKNKKVPNQNNQSMPNLQQMQPNSQFQQPPPANNPSIFQQQAMNQFPQMMYSNPYQQQQPPMMYPPMYPQMMPQSQVMMPQQQPQQQQENQPSFNQQQQQLNSNIQHEHQDDNIESHVNMGESSGNGGVNLVKGNAKNFFQDKPQDQIVAEKIEQKNYAALLQQQIELKKKKKMDEELHDQQISQNIDIDRLRKSDYFRSGPERDAMGNVGYTRAKPFNPNYEKFDWFTHGGPGKDKENTSAIAQALVQQSISPPTQPPMQPIQQPQQLQQQMQEQQSLQLPDIQSQNHQILAEQQNQMKHQGDQLSKFYEQEVDFMKKKQAMEVQHQQLMQIEENKRRAELQKLEDMRRHELEELKLLREKAANESKQTRAQEKRGFKNFNRNLFERGEQVLKFDQSMKPVEWVHKLGNIKKSRKDEYDFGQDVVRENKSRQDKSETQTRFKKSDVDGQKKALRDMEEQILIEQRIIKELPMEITKNVRDTVNKELLKLRHEMNLSNNNIGEQLMNLKGQLMKAQDRKGLVNEELRRLHQEIKQTQVVDEIRQREIYDAFMRNQPTDIIHNKDKLINPEFVSHSKKVPTDLDYLLNEENFKSNALFQDRSNPEKDKILYSASMYTTDPIAVSRVVQPHEYKMINNEVPNFNQKALNQIDQEMNIEYDIAQNRDQNNFSVKQILDDNSRRLDKLVEIDHTNFNSVNNEDKAFKDIVQSNIDRSDIAPIRVGNNDIQKIQKLEELVTYTNK